MVFVVAMSLVVFTDRMFLMGCQVTCVQELVMSTAGVGGNVGCD